MNIFPLLPKIILFTTQAQSEEEHFQISIWKVKRECYISYWYNPVLTLLCY